VPIASFSGLASGIDSSALITGLVGIARAPIARLQKAQSTLKIQAARVDDLSTKLSALGTAARALDTSDEVLSSKATSADDAIVKVSSGSGAAPGSYDIHITSLAQATRVYANPVAAKDQAGLFGAGTLSITIGTTTTDIDVTAADTLASVAGKINDAGIDATAGLFFDGSNWRLSVSGTDTGVTNAVTFGETPGLTLGLANPANVVQSAQDAVFSVDGFPVTNGSNTVTDAVNGVTLELVKASVGATKTAVRIQRDPAALETKVNTFVKAYNDIMAAIDAETPRNGTVKAGALAGDVTLRGVQSRLRNVIGAEVAGLSGNYKTLASVGISLDRAGTMSVNATKLSAAAAKDPAGVASLFGAQGSATGVMRTLDTTITSYVTAGTGLLSAKSRTVRDRANAYDSRIDGMELRLTKYEEGLKRQFASLERLISGMNSQSSQLSSVMGRG